MYFFMIEVDFGCCLEVCVVIGIVFEGFCFIEKGEFDVQCNLVFVVNVIILEYIVIGVVGGLLVFEWVD